MEGWTMELTQIKAGSVTMEFDPDEAALLAAACRIAHFYADEAGCTLVDNPLEALGGAEATSLALAGYAAMFEAGMTASVALWNVSAREIPNISLTGLRKRGTGWRKTPPDKEPARTESAVAS